VQQHPPTERLVAEAEPVMREMAKEIQQSCHLGIIEGSEVVIIAQANPTANTGFYVKLGSTVDLMQAATGQVILAYLDEGEREHVLKDWREKAKRTLPRDLSLHLDRIRAKGVEQRKSYQDERTCGGGADGAVHRAPARTTDDRAGERTAGRGVPADLRGDWQFGYTELRARTIDMVRPKCEFLSVRHLDVEPVQLRLRGRGQVLPLVMGRERLTEQECELCGAEH
jgi:hypothetical protein